MPFWKVQRATRANVTDGSAARETTPNIEPIQVFTAERHLEGWVIATQQRMTDVLNVRESIRICVDERPTRGKRSTATRSCWLHLPSRRPTFSGGSTGASTGLSWRLAHTS